MNVLEEKNFPYRHEYVIYEKASHYLAVPPECLSYNGKSEESTQKILQKIMTMEAEYPLECRKARQESWNKLVSFFRVVKTGAVKKLP